MAAPLSFEDLTWRGQVGRLRGLARRGLARFGLEAEALPCQGHWENSTFCAQLTSDLRPVSRDHHPRRVLVRVHRPGYQSAASIASELDWLDALAGHERLAVPKPLRTRDGSGVVELEEPGVPGARLVSVLRWLPGSLVATNRRGLEDERTLGETLAHLHEQARAWRRPRGFNRRRLDASGLFGGDMVGERLQAALARVPKRARERIGRGVELGAAAIARAEASCGELLLIHADLHAQNLVRHARGLGVIDFDDCSFACPALDVATALGGARSRDDWPERRAAFAEGYGRVRQPGPELLDGLDGLCVARVSDWLLWAGARAVDNPGFRKTLEASTDLVLERLRRLGC